MIGELYLYTDEDEDRVPNWNKDFPSNGDVCMLINPEEQDDLQDWVILRKNKNGAWVTYRKFIGYLFDRKIGRISEQKAYHLLAGYTLRRLSFTKKRKETVH